MVLLMSVNPGFGGQKFIPDILNKTKKLKKIIKQRKLNVLIEVDGGVKLDNAAGVAKAGADILVMGSAFFSSGDYREYMKKLRKTLKDNK
jgi:ribulose-phosphate 3-epimerase